MMRKPFHLVMFLIIFLSHSQISPVQAQEPGLSTVSFTFKDLGEGDFLIKTSFDQVFIDFPFADGQQVNRAILKLHMTYSPKLKPELSDIVIALNNEPVENYIFNPEQAADTTREFNLPLEALHPGENTILLRFNLRLVEDGCSDMNSPDLWVKILSDSSLSFDLQESALQPDLKLFPAPFSTYSTFPGSPQISLILPPNPTDAEITTAAQISASLGQASSWHEPPLWAFTADQFDQTRLAKDGLIVIDTAGSNPLAQTVIPGITILASPYNPNQLMLIISGADDAGLLQSAAMLKTLSAREILTGHFISSQNVTPQPGIDPISIGTFTNFGLETFRIRGIGMHDIYYPIDIPFDWKITSEAQVNLHFTHGRALSSASLMTTRINGFEVANIRLDSNNDTDGRLVIQLSPRQFHLGRNWLHISFDLHMPRENCKFRYFEQAWAEISAINSTMNLAHVSSQAPLELQYLPSHLVTPLDLSENLFVLPSSPKFSELTAMVRLSAKLGSYSNADTLRLQATTSDRFNPNISSGVVIAIGTPANNTLIESVDSQLPQPLRLVNDQIVPSYGRVLLAEEQTNKAGYLELLAAPWSRRTSLLVISAMHPELLYRVVAIFPSGKRSMKLEGNVAVVTVSSSTGYKLGVWAGASLSPKIRRLIAFVLIFTFVLIIGIGFFYVKFKNKGPKS